MANQALCYRDKDVLVDHTHKGKENLQFKLTTMMIEMTIVITCSSFPNRVFKQNN